MILIGSVFEKELEPLIQRMVVFEQGEVFNRRYIRGVIGRNEIIAFSGISGKVETAFMLQKMIDEYRPDSFFLLSEAEALSKDMKSGDLVFGEAYREYDKNASDQSPVPLIAGNIDFVIHLRKEFPETKSGVIISGDSSIPDDITRDTLYLKHRAIAADRDSASAAIVCRANGVCFMAIKVIVTLGGSFNSEDYQKDYETYFHKPAEFFAAYIEKNYLSFPAKKG